MKDEKITNILTIFQYHNNIITKGKLNKYYVWQHVPSDIATGDILLQPNTWKTQEIYNEISTWTNKNKIKLNGNISHYIIF